MPGPIFRMASDSCDDLDAYESCEDVRETWKCTNGNLEGSDRFEECVEEEEEVYRRTYTNGTVQEEEDEEVRTVTTMHEVVVSERKRALLEEEEVGEESMEGGRRFARLEEELEEMECEDEEGEGAVEAVNVSVVEAKMSVEFASALTRQKIASVQRGRTLSYADKDDVEEPPTRRPRPLAHARESMEIGSPDFRGSSVAEDHRLSRRAVRVSRNPSYQAAMRGPATLSPPSQVTPPPSPVQLEQSSSCEGTPSREGTPATIRERSPSVSNNNTTNNNNMNNNNNNNLNPTSIIINNNDKTALSVAGDGAKRSATEGAPPAPHGANMPRSASFSGSEAPALPDPRGSGSLSQGNSRAGSVSPLPSPSPRRSGSRLSGDEQPSTPVRGSVISRSFRKLFSTPSRSPQPPQPQPPTVTTTAPPEDYRHEFSDADSPTPSDGRSSSGSRLRRISSSLSRRLSTRSKMSTSSSTGSNGQGATNGSLQVEDCRQLVEYEDLLKLFICCGCQITMVPPLHQCRKGHLVCGTCRLSLKQVCPVCRQRFAESTNLMMEQVCQLIKFPCRFSDQGCPEYHQPKSRPDHEHFCSYRPVHCHHGPKGCPKILRFKDMHQHLDECEYK